VKKALRNNGLSLFFGLIFLLALLGQALTGHALFNEEQVASGLEEITFAQYLVSSNFAVDVSENWQSEYLQFLLYIFATIWLVQKGSPESKELNEPGPESDKEQLVGEYSNAKSPKWARVSGWRRTLYSNSLGLTMGLIFILSWLVQSIAGNSNYNQEQIQNFQQPASWGEYIASAEFCGGRFHGCPGDLPPPARLTGVQARRLRARRYGNHRLAPPARQFRLTDRRRPSLPGNPDGPCRLRRGTSGHTRS
jgi:hypothetical protein